MNEHTPPPETSTAHNDATADLTSTGSNASVGKLVPAVSTSGGTSARRERLFVAATLLCACGGAGLGAFAASGGGESAEYLSSPPVILPVPIAIEQPVYDEADWAYDEYEEEDCGDGHEEFDEPMTSEMMGVIHVQGKAYLVLESADDSIWTGSPHSLGEEDDMAITLRRGVVPAMLLPETLELPGTRVDLYGATGKTCSAVAGELSVLARGFDYDLGDDLDAVWESLRGTEIVVASLDEVEGDCADAVWARDHALMAPVVATIDSEGERVLRRRALNEYRALDAYAEIQREFEAETGTRGAWHRFDDYEPEITVIKSPSSTMVVVSTAIGGCGDFSAELSAVFSVDGDDWSRLDTGEHRWLGIDAAADLDGDGTLELVGHAQDVDRVVLRNVDGELSTFQEASVVSMVCGC